MPSCTRPVAPTSDAVRHADVDIRTSSRPFPVQPVDPRAYARCPSTLLPASSDGSWSCLQGVVLFKIDGAEWTLDLRPDSQPSVEEGPPPADVKPDLTLTISDDNFGKLVMGKLGPQQVSP